MNNKKILLLIVMIFIAGIINYQLNHKDVKILDVHQDDYSVAIIVDRLPYSDSKKIAWWLSHQEHIASQYKIKSTHQPGPASYYFYAIGDGYSSLGSKDRICFNDMPPPTNCLDKNLLMKIQRNKDNNVTFTLNSGRYGVNRDGNIIKLAVKPE